MSNHVHLVLAPRTPDGLSRAVGEAHRRYTAFFDARARMTGHLLEGRSASVAMDETHLLDAPVAAAPASCAHSADLLELSLAEPVALEGFETKSANGRPSRRF